MKLLILATLLLLPTSLFAHVKWFAEEQIIVRPYQLTDGPVIAAILIALGILAIGVYLERKLVVPHWFARFTQKYAPLVLSLASIGFGLSFILFSFNNFIFAPNLAGNGITDPLIIIQLIAGILLLIGFYERIGTFLILALFAFGILRYGTIEMLDTLEMIGFALYALIIGRPRLTLADSPKLAHATHKLHAYGLPILRIGTGLNLIILGFSEKILAPGLTADFLARYDWNFMHNLGFEWFSNYWFAFSAGVGEILFGVFFVLGLVTRTTTLALAVFLITTLLLLGPTELLGHLPHFSIAIALLILGSGARLKIQASKA